MRSFKLIILASFFLIFSSFGKMDIVRLEFEILDSTTLDPVIFAEVKLHFDRTKESKTYEVIRKTNVKFDGTCVLEIEKEIFFSKYPRGKPHEALKHFQLTSSF